MEIALVAGIFTIVGAFIGFYINLLLRKEQFKEIVYKEKFAFYKKLTEELAPIITETVYLSQEGEKSKELIAQTYRFITTLHSGWFIITNDILNAGLDIFDMLTSSEISGKPYEVLGEKFRKFLGLIRLELHAKAISEGIKETLDFGFKSSKEPEND